MPPHPKGEGEDEPTGNLSPLPPGEGQGEEKNQSAIRRASDGAK
ncbi:MAG: hypothetical protein K0R86_1890 [Enterobacter kobei]|nr:hypothetical protein [Enterobacter kobei]